VSICRIKCPFPVVKENEKLISDPHPNLDQHQNLITSRRSALVTIPTMFGRHVLMHL